MKRKLLAATAFLVGAALPLAAGAAEPAATAPGVGMVSAEGSIAEPLALLLTNLQDAELVNASDETVAQVEDVLIDDQGQVHALVVSEGGVLGVGQEYRLITLEAGLPPMSDERILVDMRAADVDTLPVYSFPEVNEESAATAGAPRGASPTAEVAVLWPLGKLIGTQVRSKVGEDAESAGDIEDVRLSADGQVRSFVLDRGGLFGLGSDERELAFERTAVSGTPAQPVVTATGAPVGGAAVN